MKLSFVCYGGSGSTWLIKRLQRQYKVHVRPETYWLPCYFPQQTKSATSYDQQLTIQGYTNLPTPASAKGFERRAGYCINLSKSIDDNLVDYWAYMQKNPKAVTMFSRAPMLGFFERHKDTVDNVVFIVRHPLHQYISLTKPKRHAEFVADFGGFNTVGGVKFFVREWSLFVRDALNSGASVVRYEFAKQDSKKLSKAVQDVFNKFNSSPRNPGKLDTNLEELLEDDLKDLYYSLYNDWNV